MPLADSQNTPSNTPAGPERSSRLHYQNLFSVEGMVALITGGGTGIGLMMAKALEEAGATVYIVGRREDVLERAARDNNTYGRIIPLLGDVRNRDDLVRLAETVKREKGYLDLLVNNAGIARNLFSHPLPSPSDGQNSSILDFQRTLWNNGSPAGCSESFETNVTAPYYTTVAFLHLLYEGNRRQRDILQQNGTRPDGCPAEATHPHPIRQAPHHSSQVITVSSSGAFRIDARVTSPSYTVVKAATTHLGKLLANLLAPWGIRSNVLAPGVWPSEMTTQTADTGVVISLDALVEKAVPLGRAGTEEEMAGTILYLASRAGAYVNGAVFLVDGGRVASIASCSAY